jgi:hypothetical protein
LHGRIFPQSREGAKELLTRKKIFLPLPSR